jgi:hypothetical protein
MPCLLDRLWGATLELQGATLEVKPLRLVSTAREIRKAERRGEALELRKAGASFPSIGKALGITQQAAGKLIRVTLSRIVGEPAEQVRGLELSRLDRAHAALWAQVCRGHLPAVDRLLKIMERRAKLLGLDISPIESSGQIRVTLEALVLQSQPEALKDASIRVIEPAPISQGLPTPTPDPGERRSSIHGGPHSPINPSASLNRVLEPLPGSPLESLEGISRSESPPGPPDPEISGEGEVARELIMGARPTVPAREAVSGGTPEEEGIGSYPGPSARQPARIHQGSQGEFEEGGRDFVAGPAEDSEPFV